MSEELVAELIALGPGGILAAMVSLALLAVWRLWRTEASARQTEARTAAESLFEQRIVNVQASGTIDRLGDRLSDCERDRDTCERARDQARTATRREAAE